MPRSAAIQLEEQTAQASGTRTTQAFSVEAGSRARVMLALTSTGGGVTSVSIELLGNTFRGDGVRLGFATLAAVGSATFEAENLPPTIRFIRIVTGAVDTVSFSIDMILMPPPDEPL